EHVVEDQPLVGAERKTILGEIALQRIEFVDLRIGPPLADVVRQQRTQVRIVVDDEYAHVYRTAAYTSTGSLRPRSVRRPRDCAEVAWPAACSAGPETSSSPGRAISTRRAATFTASPTM